MQSQSSPIANLIATIIFLGILVFVIAGFWKMYQKANQPGWAILIPIYNLYILLKIVGRPWWWLLLFFIPFVNIAVSIVVAIDLAKSFGRSTLFGVVLLWLFSFIGYLVLGYGNSTYRGPSAMQTAPTNVEPAVVQTP